MKKDRIIYWIFTGLISAWMVLQGVMFTFMSSQIEPLLTGLGLPLSIIIPLGIAKLLAVISILWKKSNLLKQLAYLGLFIDFAAAIISHIRVDDGQWPGASVALLLLVISFIYDRKVFPTKVNIEL